jgi:hypothetical protein
MTRACVIGCSSGPQSFRAQLEVGIVPAEPFHMAAKKLLCAILAFAAAAASPTIVAARITRLIPCEELWSRSDLVVIARPATTTRDTDETTYFPGIVTVHPDRTETRVKAVGVETTFIVIEVLKGDFAAGRQLVLHHLRETHDGPATAPDGRILVEMDGPTAMTFNPSDEHISTLPDQGEGRPLRAIRRPNRPRYPLDQEHRRASILFPSRLVAARCAPGALLTADRLCADAAGDKQTRPISMTALGALLVCIGALAQSHWGSSSIAFGPNSPMPTLTLPYRRGLRRPLRSNS